jgi:hypothetical protein
MAIAKPCRADGTAPRGWESRSLPGFFYFPSVDIAVRTHLRTDECINIINVSTRRKATRIGTFIP